MLRRYRRLLPGLPFAILLTGCAMENTATQSPVAGTAISGVAFGGQQPITGAKVYLLAVGPGGYGDTSLSLLTSSATGNAVDSVGAYGITDSVTGKFALANDYSCTKGYLPGTATLPSNGTTLSGSEQVYLYVLGGNAGAGANTSIGLLAALGPCNAQYSTSLVVNEITTAAAAYALAGFATDATHIASSNSALALTGLANAGVNSASLVNVATGLPVANTNAITRPVATLYTLGDMLAACVNGVSGNSNCSTLFQYTKSSGSTGTQPTDTATAAINLAHNPWPTATGMTALYGLVPATGAPFSGGLASQPNDFNIALKYANQGYVLSVAIDASGNAWTANSTLRRVTKFFSTGSSCQSCTFSPYVSNPYAVAIDSSENVWVANYGNSTISEFSDNLSGTNEPQPIAYGYQGGGLDGPCGVAIDTAGNIWAANYTNNSVSQTSNIGTAISPSAGYTGGGLNGPCGIAIDTSGNVWAGGYGVNAITKLSSNGVAVSPSTGYVGGGLNEPTALAIDSSGNVWAANLGSNYNGVSVSEFSSTGAAISGTGGFTGGGLNGPQGIAIDGSGNVWVADSQSACITELSSTGAAISPSTGYTVAGYPVSIAIDGSGDVWAPGYSGSLTELIGAATPVVTPIVANLAAPYGAYAVNRP